MSEETNALTLKSNGDIKPAFDFTSVFEATVMAPDEIKFLNYIEECRDLGRDPDPMEFARRLGLRLENGRLVK